MIRAPLSTYRLQLRPGFGFHEAAELVPYLADLGVSHLYASPYLQAAPGSTHGYDVVSYDRPNDELGGWEGHAALCRALEAAGLGQILDIVPNHMAISGPENTWWWDVLENGPASRYASVFDVEWEPTHAREENRVLLPILGDHYGRVLEGGELKIVRDAARFSVRYHEHAVPVAPRSLRTLLAPAAARSGSDELAFLADAFGDLPLPTVLDQESLLRRHRDTEVLQGLLSELLGRDDAAARAVDAEVDRLQADADRLDAFLGEQNYRLAFWRTAGDELGYRRFFDISSLVGLHMEDPAVFEETHRLILRWLDERVLDGVRVDHPDGLRDPEGYLRRLREAAPEAWIVVEKILHPGERLRPSWPVQGTTGYEVLNLLGGLFVDPAGEEPLTRLYDDVTRAEPRSWPMTVRQKKHQVLRELFGSDTERLAALAARVCEGHRRHRDYTRRELVAAIRSLIACFPVYRTYVRAAGEGASDDDVAVLRIAEEAARADAPDLDPGLFEFLRDVLLWRWPGDDEAAFVLSFQQLTGAVEAKGVEDTAFYSYHPLVAQNEVGGDPSHFGTLLEDFHAAMSDRQAHQPLAMSTTSTHDTKRSEDVRARLFLLSEAPERWARTVRELYALNAPKKESGWPDENLEYLLYQLLVGAWPVSEERVQATLRKAAREAKEHTSWTQQNGAYEAAVERFVAAIFADQQCLKALEQFVTPLIAPGRINAMAQALLKLTMPGVPDLYQGTERWDLSFVDPDNRRPVDFAAARAQLDEARGSTPEAILARVEEGLPKLWVTHRALSVRRALPGVFGAEGGYQPLAASGPGSAHVVAFARTGPRGPVVAAVPRFLLRLVDGGEASMFAQTLDTTRLALPPGDFVDAFTGAAFGGEVTVQGLWSRFPVSLLVPRGAM